MTALDPKETLREFCEFCHVESDRKTINLYFASSYEALSKLSKRVRTTNVTLRDLLSGNR